MRVELNIDPKLNAPRAVIHTPAMTDELAALIRTLEGEDGRPNVVVWREGEVRLIPRGNVLRWFADGKGVSCQTVEGTFSVRRRLYELEADLAGTRFVRVSHSEIVNLDRITALDLSVTGTIRITLEGGTTVYTSRRYVKKIKDALGL